MRWIIVNTRHPPPPPHPDPHISIGCEIWVHNLDRHPSMHFRLMLCLKRFTDLQLVSNAFLCIICEPSELLLPSREGNSGAFWFFGGKSVSLFFLGNVFGSG